MRSRWKMEFAAVQVLTRFLSYSTNKMANNLPQELCEEIIRYLWNDLPSLTACSLANRIMTVPSQRRLFTFIRLTDARRDWNVGSSASFYKLLIRSPHIARYVGSLQINSQTYYWSEASTPAPLGQDLVPSNECLPFEDYKLENGQEIPDLDAIAVASNRRDTWLTKDKFLPSCATLLPNLKALDIVYNASWGSLSFRSLITLLHLMQLPSLHHLRLHCRTCPISTVNMAMSSNIKHLVINANGGNEELPIQLLRPSTMPTYLIFDRWGWNRSGKSPAKSSAGL